jgi:hypothetical protein
MVSDAKAEAERILTKARQEVDELTRQRDSIQSHLQQLRQLLGGGGGAFPAPAPPAPEPAAIESNNGQESGQKQPVAASSSKGSAEDEDWWQE